MTTIMKLQIQPGESETAFMKRAQKHRQSLINSKTRTSRAAKSRASKPEKDIPALREKAGNTKYPDAVVIKARAAWVAGMKYHRIATLLAMSTAQVKLFVTRWDQRLVCVPTPEQVDQYRHWRGNLPPGPMLRSRVTTWETARRTSDPQRAATV